jgi:hypothetical protein
MKAILPIKQTVILMLLILTSGTAIADEFVANITQCITDATSGKDRKDLAKWVFTSMSTHPEIAAFNKIDAKILLDTEKKAGEIYNRLFTVDCKNQINSAIQNHKPQAVQVAFEELGKLSMQELMTNQNVMDAFSAPAKYIDYSKFGVSEK